MKLVSFNLGHVILQQLPHRRRRAVNLNQMKSVRAQVILVAMLAATSFAQSDVDTIIQRSVEANAEDWKIAPDYDYIERDRQQGGGTKTYEELMILGSPYERLVAVNGKPLSPERQTQEQQKLETTVVVRQKESQQERRQRIAKYEKERTGDHLMMEQLTKALDFKLVGEQKLGAQEVYVLKATPHPGYEPPNNEAKVLTGMEGEALDRQTDIPVAQGRSHRHTPGFNWRVPRRGRAGYTLRTREDACGRQHLAPEAFCHEIAGQNILLVHTEVASGRSLLRLSQTYANSSSRL